MKPKHVGIILDGNRRFAKRLMLEPHRGHELGFEKLKELFKWCAELEIKELTLYCFSMQNFNRPKKEFDFLMGIFEKALKEAMVNEDIHRDKIKVRIIGRWHLLPEKLQPLIKELMEKTKDYDKYTLNIALAYGGREEIIDAVKKVGRLIENGKITDREISEELISKNLYLESSPDFIIRTGGERRTSNFLAWQSVYSEWIFLEKKWPEFEKEDLIKCIEDFEKRERRFGK